MKSALIFLALVALSLAGPMSRKLGGRIVNGEAAKPGEIPFQVSLQRRGSNFHFCGGSVFNKHYVITAAHCVAGKSASDLQIIAGSVNLKDPKSTHLAVKIIVHEHYDRYNSWVHDIALIKVDEPFEISETLKFAPLPESNQEIPADSVAVVSGWGRLWQDGPTPIKLQRAKILIAGQNYCRKTYDGLGYDIYEGHLCAHDPVEETGSCHGDSGGPLTVDGKLVGLVSWANGCANVHYPTVYTRVPKYLDWINENAV